MNRNVMVALPLTIGMLIAVVSWATNRDSSSESQGSTLQDPISLSSGTEVHGTLSALLDHTDLVVFGTITKIQTGRSYSDPAKPEAGIISQLVSMEVAETLFGPPTDSLIVEQEAFLLDGTPLVIDDVPALQENDTVLLFLRVDPTGQSQHFGIIGPQGAYSANSVDTDVPLEALGIAATSNEIESFDGLPVNEVRRRIHLN